MVSEPRLSGPVDGHSFVERDSGIHFSHRSSNVSLQQFEDDNSSRSGSESKTDTLVENHKSDLTTIIEESYSRPTSK